MVHTPSLLNAQRRKPKIAPHHLLDTPSRLLRMRLTALHYANHGSLQARVKLLDMRASLPPEQPSQHLAVLCGRRSVSGSKAAAGATLLLDNARRSDRASVASLGLGLLLSRRHHGHADAAADSHAGACKQKEVGETLTGPLQKRI